MGDSCPSRGTRRKAWEAPLITRGRAEKRNGFKTSQSNCRYPGAWGADSISILISQVGHGNDKQKRLCPEQAEWRDKVRVHVSLAQACAANARGDMGNEYSLAFPATRKLQSTPVSAWHLSPRFLRFSKKFNYMLIIKYRDWNQLDYPCASS